PIRSRRTPPIAAPPVSAASSPTKPASSAPMPPPRLPPPAPQSASSPIPIAGRAFNLHEGEPRGLPLLLRMTLSVRPAFGLYPVRDAHNPPVECWRAEWD